MGSKSSSSNVANSSKPTLSGKPLGSKGVHYRLEGQKLVIEVDASSHFGPSSTGKNLIIASTEGNKQIEVNGDDVCIGINIYRTNPNHGK